VALTVPMSFCAGTKARSLRECNGRVVDRPGITTRTIAQPQRQALPFARPVRQRPARGGRRCYAGRTTTFVLTGVREYRCIMSCVSRPTQPLVMPLPIDSASRLA